MEWKPRDQKWKPSTPEPPASGNLHSAGALGGCIHFHGRQVAVGRLAALSHSPAQAPPAASHKDSGWPGGIRHGVPFRGPTPPGCSYAQSMQPLCSKGHPKKSCVCRYLQVKQENTTELPALRPYLPGLHSTYPIAILLPLSF